MCHSFLKIMMFIFNGVIFLAGVAILGVGVWVTVDSDSLLGLLDGVENLPDEVFRLAYVGYVMIALGAALLIIGFLGCCGAIMENRCMLLTFFCVVLIIFLIEVAGAVVLFVFDNVAEDIFDNLEDEVRKTIREKYGSDERMTSVWNATMERFECCGYKNYTDFDDSPFNLPEDNYPSPCCSGTDSMVVCSSHNAASSSVPGCFVKLVDWLEENSVIIAGVAIGVAALEIAAMVVSMILYCNAGRKSK